MRRYHDEEWGVPISDDRRLFEKVCLEAFQCGLSWSTVLARRDRLREVFAQFDVDELVRFSKTDLEKIAEDPTVIRHRGKIAAVVNNAHACRRLRDEVGSLAAHMWSFAPSDPADPGSAKPPSVSDESMRMARDLKHRGWVFVGPTTMYALMQSAGMVNDHDRTCPVRTHVEMLHEKFLIPTSNRN